MAEHDAMVRAALRHHQGEEVKSTGDGFLAVFDAATKAVRAAIEVVTRAEALGIQLRAGVHTGEVEVRPDDVVGLPVNVAKRVCDLAAPSQVLATEIVRLQAAGSDIALHERGVFELKGVPGTWEVFAVVNDSARIRGR
jgi:class 3 adenylate cyclase